MNRSFHPSCFIATFSNNLKIHNINIHDDLLFGLSRSIDFQYDVTRLPLSGETHTFWGINLDAYMKLATAFQIQYDVFSVDENKFMEEMDRKIAAYGSVIVEVSIKEYLDMLFQTDLTHFFDVVMESNTNHTINVVSMDEDDIYVLDNYSLDTLKMSKQKFLNAVFPKEEAIIPSRGRIHCFDTASINPNIGETKLIYSIRRNMLTFLYSSNAYTGLRALHRFHHEISFMLQEQDAVKRERNIQMFHLSCAKAGNGSFYRKNFLRFLRKAASFFPTSEELMQAQDIYRDLHHLWRKFNVHITGLNDKQNDINDLYAEGIEAQFRSILQKETEGAELLLKFTERNIDLSHISHEASEFVWDFTNVSCASYFEQMNLDYQFKCTNVFSDIENDYVQYQNKAILFMVDYKLKKLVPYEAGYKTNQEDHPNYHYFIVHALGAG